MALRKILTDKDEMLHKVCKPVEKFDEKLAQLLDDMHETLDKAQGLGLAAPQIGVCRRIFIMHLDEGPVEAINPEVTKREGKQRVTSGFIASTGPSSRDTSHVRCIATSRLRIVSETGLSVISRNSAPNAPVMKTIILKVTFSLRS